MTRPDTPTDLDLAAFAEGGLDPARRHEVAGWLAARPDRAAAVMADLALTEGLRLALAGPASPPPPEMLGTARRLERALARRHALRRFWPVAATAAAFALGWTGHALVPRPGPLAPVIAAALDAEAALAARHAMALQPETPRLDAAEIAARLGVTLPPLPQGWQIRDVQVVATPGRPGVAIALDTPGMGRILLFSVALPSDGPDLPPDSFRRAGKALAVFEKGQAAYVLVDASAPIADLAGGAQELLRGFN